MHVRKEDSPADPAYPDAKEFLKNRATLGAAILGAGMALGGCNPVTRLGGIAPPPLNGSKEACVGAKTDKPVRLGGEIPAEPKTEPPRTMGKYRIEPKPEPPALPGTPPMVPPNPEH